MSVLVKICGLTGETDVSAALEAGADALGFVFAESVRRVSPEHAAKISRRVPDDVLRVAVMLHPSAAEWSDVARVFRPDVLQADAEDFANLDVADGIARWPVYRENRDGGVPPGSGRFLYEGPKSGRGETVDWGRAARIAQGGEMILAGGLGPGNVADAIRAVHPFGVDASSSLESAPGRKAPDKMTTYVAAARAAARE